MATSKGGWTGRLLDINLTTSTIEERDSIPLMEQYIGASGAGQAVLFNEIPDGAGPMDPANIVVISSGPLVGTAAPAASRLHIDTMNAFTGGTNFSNAGGHFAAELKYAGFDTIILRGQAPEPVYLEIIDGKARLKRASHLWGMTVGATEDAIRQEMGDPRVKTIAIGPAGENLVKAACVIVDRGRAAGRGGIGAVFGSKRVKAVAVRGTLPVRVARPEAFRAAAERAFAILENEAAKNYRKYGTYLGLPTVTDLCRVPYRNHQDDYIDPKRIVPILPDVFEQNYKQRKLGCFNCPNSCSTFMAVKSGDYAGTRCEGIHENTLENFGVRLDINDPNAIIHMQGLCSELGLDIDGSSIVIAWAIDCFERGLLTTADTGGMELRWGDHQTAVKLLWQLAERRGFGEILALGVKEAASHFSPEAQQLAMHIKGQDLQETLRAAKGWGFGVVVSTRGGTHMDGAPRTERGWDKPPEFLLERFGTAFACDPSTLEGKPDVVKWHEAFKSVADSLGMCYLATEWGYCDSLWPDDLAAMLSAATGRDYTGSDLLAIGERIHNIKKAFNTLHQGFSRKDDMPPARFLNNPVKGGPKAGAVLETDDWNRALDRYYTLHGWDVATGWQTEEGLRALGLNHVAERLARAGRLAPSRITKPTQ